MTLPKSILLAFGGMLLSFTQCSWLPWGEAQGSLCQGEEHGLESIAAGRSLEGWWTLVPNDAPEGKGNQNPGGWDYLQIDRQNRPRALHDDHPAVLDQTRRDGQEVFFGCQNYLDYPLVEGASNRSPSESRNTIRPPAQDCSSESYPLSPELLRTLMRIERSESTICLAYRSIGLAETSPSGPGTARYEEFCFSYEPSVDRIKLSHSDSNDRITSWSYQRMIPPQSDQSSTREALSFSGAPLSTQSASDTGPWSFSTRSSRHRGSSP